MYLKRERSVNFKQFSFLLFQLVHVTNWELMTVTATMVNASVNQMSLVKNVMYVLWNTTDSKGGKVVCPVTVPRHLKVANVKI